MLWNKKRRSLKITMALLAIFVGGAFMAKDSLYFTFLYRGSRADWELSQIDSSFRRAAHDFRSAKKDATSAADVDTAKEQLAAQEQSLIERCISLANDNPNTAAEIGALYVVACRSSKTELGQQAAKRLAGCAVSADLAHLATALSQSPGTSKNPVRFLATLILDRVRKEPEHLEVAFLLSQVCVLSIPDDSSAEAPSEFISAADLIVQSYADSPDIVNFCELFLGMGFGSPTWTGPFERHLRSILETNQHRQVQVAASFALASVVQAAGESRQIEAEELYRTFVTKFDGSKRYSYKNIEQELNRRARQQLEELQTRGLGKMVPDIIGVDLDGHPLKLSEYRGKVVLVNFWATWCYPCMKLIPHEVKLAKRLEGKPFAIVGVNSDTDIDAARKAVVQNGVTWRSFQDAVGDKLVISGAWQVVGYPTLYLIDQQGIVRKRWIGDPSPTELDSAIDDLLGGDSKALGAAPVELNSQHESTNAESRRLDETGFVDKVFNGSDGVEAKYVVFIPRNYDGQGLYPTILFLHGAGYVGFDSRAQLSGALAEVIRQDEASFRFITIFPQAHHGSWEADSDDGRRALAILDEVQKQYRVDPQRIYLTGLSMGGEGTWSLAAADPGRWAAIVPVAGGGDPQSADKFKQIPCWCFHGDADKVVPVQLSREMVRALQQAGGRPLYQEHAGLGHNEACWHRTYANPDLYDWLLR